MSKRQRRATDVGASYARFSSELQNESSNDNQQRGCRDLAAKEGVPLPPEQEFEDEAVSGTKRDRAGLDAMMAAARAGSFSRLYVSSLSRLSREMVITLPLLKELVHHHGVSVVSVEEGFDTRHPTWELQAAMLGFVHEKYLKDLSAAVFRGQVGVVLAGHSVGDYCFGYRSVPVEDPGGGPADPERRSRRYAIDPEEAKWVALAFVWFAVDLRSIGWISRELTRRGAPKDHRATTKAWHPSSVSRMLDNEKYVGRWAWGRKKNVREPFRGAVSQEDRPADESRRWTREFPGLRIVSDELWAKARARRAETAEADAARHGPGGKLRGPSAPGGPGRQRHLLEGLIRCAHCGGTYHVRGTGAAYLGCSGYLTGACARKTTVPRERAERRILEAVTDRIRDDPAWHAAVLEEADSAWRAIGAGLPDRVAAARRALAEADAKVAKLVDAVETRGLDDPDLSSRLAQRRGERDERRRELEGLERSASACPGPPTPAWVEVQLARLREVLAAGGPAGAGALRKLVGGSIEAQVIEREGRDRHSIRLTFRLGVGSLSAAAEVPAGRADPHAGDLVEVDLREPCPSEALAGDVKRLADEGLLINEVAARLGVSRNLARKAWASWHAARGLDVPDGRSRRATLARKGPAPPAHVASADAVMALYNDGVALWRIADRLGLDPNQVTRAVAHWHRTRGLEVPDGRTRRKGSAAGGAGRIAGP